MGYNVPIETNLGHSMNPTVTVLTGRVSVRKNAYGNYGGFVGRHKVLEYGSAYHAKLWLAGQLLANATISTSSYFSAEEVEKYKALV